MNQFNIGDEIWWFEYRKGISCDESLSLNRINMMWGTIEEFHNSYGHLFYRTDCDTLVYSRDVYKTEQDGLLAMKKYAEELQSIYDRHSERT